MLGRKMKVCIGWPVAALAHYIVRTPSQLREHSDLHNGLLPFPNLDVVLRLMSSPNAVVEALSFHVLWGARV